MALVRPSLDYTDRDFDALSARIRNLIRGGFPLWTDESQASFGNLLVDLFAFVGDNLAFYQDQQAQESRITTAVLRRSMLGHCKLLTYRPRGAEAATVDLTVRLAAVPSADVSILAGDRFRTQRVTAAISFQVLEDVVIAAGTDPPVVTVTLEHSTNATDTFQSTSLPNQDIVLNETPFLDGSLAISASDGDYTIVDNFLESVSTDRHATVAVDETDKATVRFGNGASGAIPQGVITCQYKAGGGVIGNVEADSIRRPERTYTDLDGNPVQLIVTNREAAQGGADRQTVAAIREAAPRSLTALTRSVGRDDFEVHALKVAGVARALFLTDNERPGIGENCGHLVIIPNGGGQPSELLKAAVLEQITVNFPHTVTFSPTVVGAAFKAVNVQAVVFPSFGTQGTPEQRQGTQAQRIKLDALIRSTLVTFFALTLSDGGTNTAIDFGYRIDGLIAYSDLYNAVRDVSNVRRIGDGRADFLVNGTQQDVELEPHEFPTLGTVTLYNGFTGNLLTA